MSLLVQGADGSRVLFNEPIFDTDVKTFVLISRDSPELRVTVPYALPLVGKLGCVDFSVHLLKRDGNSESDIFQVYDGGLGHRVGWLIPLAALESTDHDMVQDQFFSNYAFAAYYKLLAGKVSPLKEAAFRRDGNYRLSDFCDDDAVAFVLSTKAVVGIADFRVEDYYASFLMNGYTASRYSGDCSFAGANAKIDGEKRVTVHRMAQHLRRDPYITKLLAEPLLGNPEPLVEFFLLYQVFEMLMERMFEIVQIDIITEYLSAPKPTLGMVKNLFEKLDDARSDKQRMIMLFKMHFPNGLDIRDARDVCNEFLALTGGKEGIEIQAFLYPIRNKLVHELRGISPSALAVVPRINDALKGLVAQILIHYVN